MTGHIPPEAPGCGDGPDSLYCPVFWSMYAQLDHYRNLTAEIISKASILTAYDVNGDLSALIDQLAELAKLGDS